MSDILIKNANIVSLDAVLKGYSLLCQGGKIVKIAPDKDLQQNSDAEIIDAAGGYLSPGFIDLHTHGLKDYLIDNGPDDLLKICNLLPEYGVTGFLPTVCPLPKGKDASFVKSLSSVKSPAAKIFGFHMEGPFLTMTGALSKDALGKADIQRVKDIISAAKPHRSIFSISPDFEGIEDLMPVMAAGDTPVFITHTRANVKQTQLAIEAGASHATHFYDVFPCPDEIDPGVRPCGVVEAVLADERVSVDFIVDGEHVDPVAVKMALQCKGPDKVCLITDANIGAGNPPGVYQFGDEKVEFKYQGGPARMTADSAVPGGLAGSGLTMDLAVKNTVEMVGLDLPLAVKMASDNPARVLGLKNTGKIKVGYDADIVLLDEGLKVTYTLIAGKIYYRR